MTALKDALAAYLRKARRPRRASTSWCVYTDGGDSRSRIALRQVPDALRAGNAVWADAIGYLENQLEHESAPPAAAPRDGT